MFPVLLADWWLLSILALIGMLAMMIGCRLMPRYLASTAQKKTSWALAELNPNCPDVNVFARPLERNVHHRSLITTKLRIGLWSRVATGTYVAMALSCAALYFASRFPGAQSPFWYPLVANAFTFASARLLNLDEEGE